MEELIKLLSIFTAWTIAGAVAIKYIGQKIVDRLFERDAIKFKNEFERELKLFDANLKDTSTKYQIQFSNLHTSRANVITELYKLIVEVEYSTGSYIQNSGNVGEAEQNMLDALNILKRRYYETDIYFNDSINSKILSLINAFVGVYADYTSHLSYGEYRDLEPDLKKEKKQLRADAINGMVKNIPLLKTELKKEYQSILGFAQ